MTKRGTNAAAKRMENAHVTTIGSRQHCTCRVPAYILHYGIASQQLSVIVCCGYAKI
jgi:hypothetical protein